MPGDLEVSLAFVARREGRRSMPAARWAHVISLDLGWMPPADARTLVALGVAAAFLRPDGESLALSFDPATVDVPRGFRPKPPPADASPGTAAGLPQPVQGALAPATGPVASPPHPPSPAVDPFLGWVERLATHTGSDRRRVLAQVSELQDRMGGMVTALAAVLWLAARAGLDVREAAAAAVSTP